MRLIAVLAAVLWLAACAISPRATAPAADPFAAIAPAYVKLVLGVGEHEDGYVDAYYGPAEWQAEAKANKRSIPELKAEADRLLAATAAIDARRLDPLSRQRKAFLHAHLTAVRFRLDMIEGLKPRFVDEAKALFAVDLDLKPLAYYDRYLAEVDALVPGDGPLGDRVEAFRNRFVIPKDRLEPVFRAAIAECRRRTAAHIALPADESFALEFVTNKSWSGYNWYKGSAHSLIQVNTDFPIFIDRAVDLGCHEGYPGHHTHNALLEQRLVKDRGFVEFSVYPLFSPLSVIAEGTSNHGVDLAFPGAEKTRFEAEVLYPLAGLDPKEAEAYDRLLQAMSRLALARMTIARDYLDGAIDRETAIAMAQKYQLISRQRAEQSIRFTEGYRTYVINYGLGEEMARAYVGDDWKRMEQVLSRPTLPGDLLR